MPKAQQTSSLPTRKLIAAVVVVPVVSLLAPQLGFDLSPETLSMIVTAAAAIVGYLVPPAQRDQIEEVIQKLQKDDKN